MSVNMMAARRRVIVVGGIASRRISPRLKAVTPSWSLVPCDAVQHSLRLVFVQSVTQPPEPPIRRLPISSHAIVRL